MAAEKAEDGKPAKNIIRFWFYGHYYVVDYSATIINYIALPDPNNTLLQVLGWSEDCGQMVPKQVKIVKQDYELMFPQAAMAMLDN